MIIARMLVPIFFLAQAFAAGPARFSFSPKTVAPGGTVIATGNFFTAPAVGFSVSNGAGQRTILGFAFPSGGAFSKVLQIPVNLPAGR
jgi:hypothetical protein